MKTKIICEIASCHNGDLKLAKALIKSAAKNGADIIKFQDWKAMNVSNTDPDKKRYELYQFKDEWYPTLIDYCKGQGVEFLTTCFNVNRCEFLASLGLKRIKLASISLTNTELIKQAGLNFEEVIISTAMHTKEEIEKVINLLFINTKKFTILHCVANYPTLPEDANLRRLNSLKILTKEYENASIGYSDHSLDLDVAKTAIAMGVKYIEKHFSLSRDLPQISHQMYKNGKLLTTHEISIEPHELKELSNWRDKIEIMKGSGEFKINTIENLIKERYQNRYGK
jgi:sialic acid synthase SpsE